MGIGGRCTRLPSFARFRIYAWKAQYLAQDEAELGPRYDCQLCQLPERHLKNDCPRCPLAETRRTFKTEVEEEIKARFGGYGVWSFERLRDLYGLAGSMLDTNKNRVSAKWDCIMAGLAKIILGERSKARFVQLWNQRQSGK